MALKLPNEIWFEVLNLLPKSDVLSVANTSKILNDLAKPAFYRRLETKSSIPGSDRTLQLFIRSIVNNPSLAKYVNEAKIHNATVEHKEPLSDVDLSFLTPKNLTWLEGQMSEVLGSYDHVWMVVLQRPCNLDAVLALLLRMLTNLKSITMVDYGICWRNLFLERVLDHVKVTENSKGGSRTLARLEEVNFDSSDRKESVYLSHIQPYLILNTVARVSVHRLRDYNTVEFSLGSPKYNAKSIQLHSCDMRTPNMRQFLSDFGALQSFQWSTQNSLIVEYQRGIEDGIQDIARLNSSLEELVIDDAVRNWNIWRGASRLSISGFSALQKLEADSTSLLGGLQDVPSSYIITDNDVGRVRVYPEDEVRRFVAALPDSLQDLKITDCPPQILHLLPDIFRRKQSSLSGLARVTIVCKEQWRWYVGATLEAKLVREYVAKAETLGMELVIDSGCDDVV